MSGLRATASHADSGKSRDFFVSVQMFLISSWREGVCVYPDISPFFFLGSGTGLGSDSPAGMSTFSDVGWGQVCSKTS